MASATLVAVDEGPSFCLRYDDDDEHDDDSNHNSDEDVKEADSFEESFHDYHTKGNLEGNTSQHSGTGPIHYPPSTIGIDPSNLDLQSYTLKRDRVLQTLYRGLDVRNRKYRFRTYKKCFVASQAVDFMVNNGWAKSRTDAVRIGRQLQQDFNLFQHVVDPNRHPFKDEWLFFRFNTGVRYTSATKTFDTSTNPTLLRSRADSDAFSIASSSKASRKSIISSIWFADNENTDKTCSSTEDEETDTLTESLPGGCTIDLDGDMLCLTATAEILRQNVPVKYNYRLNKACFTASEVVDALISTNMASSRNNAVKIGRLLERAMKIENMTDDSFFSDSKKNYCFVSKFNTSLEPAALWRQELSRAKDLFHNNIKLRKLSYHMKHYKDCFKGTDAVDYLTLVGVASCRTSAVLVGRALMYEYNLFQHVTNDHTFEDSDYFYRFSNFKRKSSRVQDYDDTEDNHYTLNNEDKRNQIPSMSHHRFKQSNHSSQSEDFSFSSFESSPSEDLTPITRIRSNDMNGTSTLKSRQSSLHGSRHDKRHDPLSSSSTHSKKKSRRRKSNDIDLSSLDGGAGTAASNSFYKHDGFGLMAAEGILREYAPTKYISLLNVHAFSAAKAIDVMVDNGLASDRRDAVKIGQALHRQRKCIQSVNGYQTFMDFPLAHFCFVQPDRATKDSENNTTTTDEWDGASWRSSLNQARQLLNDHISLSKIKCGSKHYENSCTGADIINVLTDVTGMTTCRKDAILLGHALQSEYNLFRGVSQQPQKTTMHSALSLSSTSTLKDSTDVVYQFCNPSKQGSRREVVYGEVFGFIFLVCLFLIMVLNLMQ